MYHNSIALKNNKYCGNINNLVNNGTNGNPKIFKWSPIFKILIKSEYEIALIFMHIYLKFWFRQEDGTRIPTFNKIKCLNIFKKSGYYTCFLRVQNIF